MFALIGMALSAIVVWVGFAWLNRPEPWEGFFEPGVLNDHYDDIGGYLVIAVGVIGFVFSIVYLLYTLGWMAAEQHTLGSAQSENRGALNRSGRLG